MNKRSIRFSSFLALASLVFLGSAAGARTAIDAERENQRMQKYQEHLQILQKKIRPEADVLRQLYSAATYNEDFTVALQSARQLVTLEPQNPEYRMMEIRSLVYLHEIPELLTRIDHFVTNFPEHPATANLVAQRPILEKSAVVKAYRDDTRQPLPAFLADYAFEPELAHLMTAPNLLFVRKDRKSHIFNIKTGKPLVWSDLFSRSLSSSDRIGSIESWQDAQVLSQMSFTAEGQKFLLSTVLLKNSFGTQYLVKPYINRENNQVKYETEVLEFISDKCSLAAVSPWLDFMVTACPVEDKESKKTVNDLQIYLRTNAGWELYTPPGLAMLNSAGTELHPVISSDGMLLFFVSNGHPSLSGYDIFASEIRYMKPGPELRQRGISQLPDFLAPQNAAPGINSHRDELAPLVEQPGNDSIFYVQRKGKENTLVMRRLAPAQPRSAATTPVLVQIKSNIGEWLPGRVEIITRSKDNRLKLKTSFYRYSQVLPLPAGASYSFKVNAPGHFYDLKRVEVGDAPLQHEAQLEKILPGASIAARGVLFNSGSAVLASSAEEELDAIQELLKDNPSMKISIEGHTDNVGRADSNKELSAERAAAVKDALMGLNVPAAQMKTRGWGAERPVASNDSENGRALNRRTELKVIGSKEKYRIAFLNFKNSSNNVVYDWMQNVIPESIVTSMGYGLEFVVADKNVVGKLDSKRKTEEIDLKELERLASRTSADFVVFGDIGYEPGGKSRYPALLHLSGSIYQKKHNKILGNVDATGPDTVEIFEAVDLVGDKLVDLIYANLRAEVEKNVIARQGDKKKKSSR